MIKYTTRYINTVSLLVTIVIYFFLNITILNSSGFNNPFISNLFKKNNVQVELTTNNINEVTKEENIIQNNTQINTNEENNKAEWKIEIPSIGLEAEISEGTSKQIMDKYVGHFSETSKSIGNIGLAAHNRGYPVNYFSDVKKLKKGDVIIYKYYDFEKNYIVSENTIIKDTDWSYLENTEDNRITLITCVENEPEYRRCVQAIEKKEEVKN